MAHVYRTAIVKALSSLPNAARSQLLSIFQQGLEEALNRQAYALPTTADYLACHARKF